jgi:hypothetical protein
MRNYSYELQLLRSAALEAITTYVVANGPQTIKNYSPQRQYIKLTAHPLNVMDPEVVIRGETFPKVKAVVSVKFALAIDGRPAIEEGADLLCAVASALAKSVGSDAVLLSKPVPNIRLPYKDE